MRGPTTRISLLFLAAFALSAYGHQDTIFQVSEHGELIGVPKKFTPATLSIDIEDGVVTSVTLHLSGNVVELPDCIAGFFNLPDGEEISASGSWYHERSLLPPYLSISLPQESALYGMFSGYSLLFNLENAQLIKITRHEVILSGDGMRTKSIVPDSICSDLELAQLVPSGTG